MADKLCLNVNISGENIMGQPLLVARGVARIDGKYWEIKKDTPITSVRDYLEAFESLFEEEQDS